MVAGDIFLPGDWSCDRFVPHFDLLDRNHNRSSSHIDEGMVVMTPQELKALIESDTQAANLYNERRFGDCSVRCCEIAPKVPKQLKLSFAGLLSLYQHNTSLGMAIIEKLRQVAAHNKLVAELLPFMAATADATGWPDFSLPPIRQTLIAPEEQGGIGLTLEQAAPIFVAGEQPDTITGLDIEQLAGKVSI